MARNRTTGVGGGYRSRSPPVAENGLWLAAVVVGGSDNNDAQRIQRHRDALRGVGMKVCCWQVNSRRTRGGHARSIVRVTVF
jgi:hypothetical protein